MKRKMDRSRAENILNTREHWCSYDWEDDTWMEQAIEDCNDQIKEAQERINQLKKWKRELKKAR